MYQDPNQAAMLQQNPVGLASPGTPIMKDSSAPMPFSPQAQSTMANMYGQPMANSYDRNMGMPLAPPAAVATNTNPNYDLSNL